MAGLSPRSDRRGQVLLLGAFGIAVFLLVFAGVLNAVTHTETLAATGSDQPDSRDVAAIQEDVRRGVGGIMMRVNEGTGTYSEKERRLIRGVGNWTDAVRRQYVADVTAIRVSVRDTDEGSHVFQSVNRSLTNASGADNWTVASGITDTRRFRMSLNASSLTNGSCETGDCYAVVVDDGTATWTVTINRTAVTVDGPGETGQCPVQADPTTVDLTGGIVDGQPCAPLTFGEGVSEPYDLRFRHGGNATGTYRLTTNGSVAADGDFDPDGSPSVEPVVYAGTVRIAYRGPTLQYANEIRVAGGESDE